MNMIWDIVSLAVTVLQVPLLVVWLLLVLYLLFLTALALVARLRETRLTAPNAPSTRFTILVPAHNEAADIESCLRSLNELDYPAAKRRVLVVADNCTDATARIAVEQGAIVYERHDRQNTGKGYALEWALKRLLASDGGWAEAVVVFDADTIVHPQFLRQMDARLSAGSLALQGQYNVLEPFANWRTSLLYSALLLHNRLRPLARQALGWTTLLKGNGMCFKRSVIERFGWRAYGLAEDIEHTTALLDGGVKVEPVPGAVLYAQAAQNRRQADSQRMRWEGGRFTAARRDGSRLLRRFLRTGSVAHLDWAMDLLTPPMAILIGVPLLMCGLNLGLTLLLPGAAGTGMGATAFTAWVWAAVLLGTGVHVVGGLMISGAELKAYLYLLATPLFLIWKVQIYAAMLRGRGARGWVRTERTNVS